MPRPALGPEQLLMPFGRQLVLLLVKLLVIEVQVMLLLLWLKAGSC